MIESPFEINENSENRFYRGKINFIIRLYYYLQEGLNQVNNFKNVILGVIALAVLTRIEQDYFLIVLLGLLSLPIITIIGWIWIMRGRKSTEYFSLKYTSVYGKYGVQLSERQLQQQDEIIALLKEINGKST